MNRLVALVLVSAGVLALAACEGGGSVLATSPGSSPVAAEPGVSTFLCQSSSWDDLLQWRDSSGYVSGSFQEAQLSGQAPSEQVSPVRGAYPGR
jgi:hypothetical protein